ncbi:MAG: DUF294 nucleotidyltransferase-like domain-containing protein [Pseudoruegeria sp.]
MTQSPTDIAQFLIGIHPYDSFTPDALKDLAKACCLTSAAPGDTIYTYGDTLQGLYVILTGDVDVEDANGNPLSHLHSRNSFGERGLLRDGLAVTTAKAASDTKLIIISADHFKTLLNTQPVFARFFDRTRAAAVPRKDLNTLGVSRIMARNPKSCAPDLPISTAAQRMRDAGISSLAVLRDTHLIGIVTLRDLAYKAMANGLSPKTPVSEIMRKDPVSLPPNALGSDVLAKMMELGVGHLPVVDGSNLVGIVTQTDLTRFQALSETHLVAEIADAANSASLSRITARIPQMLAQLVSAGHPHAVVTRLITNVGDAVTRRLLELAEIKLGPPPVPYLWLACGSQGRREQTGVSDQDNCLILDDAVRPADMPYFATLAQEVSNGLDACGYVYCPGDMMATNPKWCQPLSVWRKYFRSWISKPDPMAQMLASVMFDLRPIGGTMQLFDSLHEDTLHLAAKNSIFVAHMISNSLKHTPPLGLLRGFSTLRKGVHKNTVDMKHNGVVPVVDLGRVYALQGQLSAINTRDRLQAAGADGILSKSGAQDLLDAYDLIAQTRLEHQAQQIKAGNAPDNFLAPSALSDFERAHLRDAFVIVRSLQSAIGHGRSMLG